MCKYFLEPKGIWDLVSISPTPTILFSFFVLPVWFWFWYNIFSPDSQTSFPTLLRFQKTNLFRRAGAGAQQQLVVWRCQVKGHDGRPERNDQQENQGARWPRGTNKKNLCRHQNGSSLPQTKHRVVQSSTRMRNRNTFLWKRDGLENQYPGIVNDKHKIKGRGNWNI